MTDADSITIRDMTKDDLDEVARLGRSLAGWFTPNDMKRIAIDARFENGLLAEQEGRAVGFLLYYVFEAKARIAWMGVRREHHHQGIGRRLIERLEGVLRQVGIEELYVGTLGDSVDYKPYVATRAFYRALGFKDWRRTLQDNWECPELLELLKQIERRP